ncbi:MAG TPA: FtsQ-type POTRA domain-containing protein [Actinomycetales bacterium]|nr:FtsQ-type POTRA domain-containing protein [Actinomycetales bacterium]
MSSRRPVSPVARKRSAGARVGSRVHGGGAGSAKPATGPKPVKAPKPAKAPVPPKASTSIAGPGRSTVPQRQVVSRAFMRRFAERARAQRRVAWRKVALGAVAVLVLGALAWVLLGSPWLAVKTIEVSGTSRLPAETVREMAADANGVPLARLDTKSIGRDISELPVVASVDLEREWPSTLRITVRERAPIAAVPAKGGFDLVDADGVVIDNVTKAPKGLPVVDVDVKKAGAHTVREAEKVLRSLPADLRKQVTKVSAGSQDSVTLTLSAGRTVLWGSADDADRKAEVLTVLLSTKAKVYDISAPDMPVTR